MMSFPILDGIRKMARISMENTYSPDTPNFSHSADFTDLLKPGDILLAKHKELNYQRRLAMGFMGHGGWSHAGLYTGEGKIIHVNAPSLLGDSDEKSILPKVREQSISDYTKGNHPRDFLALRIKDISDQEGLNGVERARKIGDKFKSYSRLDAARAGLMPSHVNSDKELEDFICTYLPAMAHKDVKFSDRARRHMRPGDFFSSPAVREVATLGERGSK